MRRLVILRKARMDIEQAIAFLEDVDINAAVQLAGQIETKINLLISFPFLGHPFRCGRFLGRTTLVSGYRVFYRVAENEVIVVRVLHEKRDVTRQLR
jgi:toxin ParE1/3/4